MRLTNWTATPSGGAITINGTNDEQQPTKLRSVKTIKRERYGLLRTRLVARNAAGDYVATLA
jgi:hypothetical protein